MKKIKEKIYNWLASLSERSKSIWLGVLAFTESSFFPIPPDPFLMLATFKKPKNWIKYSIIISICSIFGGVLGYIIGFFFFDSFGEWLIKTYSLQSQFEIVKELFAQNAFWAVFISAFTPIPYKIFTISSGFFVINLFVFIIASVLGRTIRFFIVGAISSFLGKKYAKILIKYFDLVTSFILLIILIYILFQVF